MKPKNSKNKSKNYKNSKNSKEKEAKRRAEQLAKRQAANRVRKVSAWRDISIKAATEYCHAVEDLCKADPQLRNKNFLKYLRKYHRLRPSPDLLVALMKVENVKLPTEKEQRRLQEEMNKGWKDAKRK